MIVGTLPAGIGSTSQTHCAILCVSSSMRTNLVRQWVFAPFLSGIFNKCCVQFSSFSCLPSLQNYHFSHYLSFSLHVGISGSGSFRLNQENPLLCVISTLFGPPPSTYLIIFWFIFRILVLCIGDSVFVSLCCTSPPFLEYHFHSRHPRFSAFSMLLLFIYLESSISDLNRSVVIFCFTFTFLWNRCTSARFQVCFFLRFTQRPRLARPDAGQVLRMGVSFIRQRVRFEPQAPRTTRSLGA